MVDKIDMERTYYCIEKTQVETYYLCFGKVLIDYAQYGDRAVYLDTWCYTQDGKPASKGEKNIRRLAPRHYRYEDLLTEQEALKRIEELGGTIYP